MNDEKVYNGSPQQYQRGMDVVSDGHSRVPVEVWCCPTPGCGSYYAASGSGDLRARHSGPKAENRSELRSKTGSSFTKSLADCGSCLQRLGVRVERVPITVFVDVPLTAAEPAPLPPV